MNIAPVSADSAPVSSSVTTDAIEALAVVKRPYARPGEADDALFRAAMAESDTWHWSRNVNYRRMWTGNSRPVIPVGLFKAAQLATPVQQQGSWLTSSGTSGGGRTEVFFDAASMTRIQIAMLQMFIHARYFDIFPARFLLLAPDPKRTPNAAGYATAFSEFTRCAPVAERVHAVEPDGSFSADLAWNTLRRWADNDATVFIFGLTVYLERLVLSAPGPVPQKGQVKALTGGGWKGLEQRLTRPQMVARLHELLPAPVCEIRDLFGLTEHPLHYFSCSAGGFHIPKYTRIAIVGADGRRQPTGRSGLIRLQNPFFASIPSHDLLTEDRGVLIDDCECELDSPSLRFLGRVTRPTGTCAATASEALKP